MLSLGAAVTSNSRLEAQSAHRRLHAGYLSCPVFGRPDAAAAKQLIMVAAGDPELKKQVCSRVQGLAREVLVTKLACWLSCSSCHTLMLAMTLQTPRPWLVKSCSATGPDCAPDCAPSMLIL